jgi:DNA-directed RNA polymerase I subunit RPA2
MQVSGFTIVAERLNFLRYTAHFQSVHRGQFFTEMKTTTVRKLLPDQWGFLCPVHTPDGGPCGLLSHLAMKCSIVASPVKSTEPNMVDLDDLLISLGVSPFGTGGERGDGRAYPNHHHLVVSLDGRVIGGAPAKLCRSIAFHLRKLKTQERPTVPSTLEVAFIPPGTPCVIHVSLQQVAFL